MSAVSLFLAFGSAAFLDHLFKLVEDLIPIEQFAARRLARTTLEFRLKSMNGVLALEFVTFKKPQGLPNHFANCLIPARRYTARKERVELWSNRNINGSSGRHT